MNCPEIQTPGYRSVEVHVSKADIGPTATYYSIFLLSFLKKHEATVSIFLHLAPSINIKGPHQI